MQNSSIIKLYIILLVEDVNFPPRQYSQRASKCCRHLNLFGITQLKIYCMIVSDKFHVTTFWSNSFVLRVFYPLFTALTACQSLASRLFSSIFRVPGQIFAMKIFKDIFSGDEMFSDTYKFKLIDGVLYEVYGKLITRKMGDVTLDGANPSAEEACEGTEDAVESGVDVVLNHRLMETYAFPDKKSFTLYLKEYMKRLVDKMNENGSTEVDVFKTNINKVSAFLRIE